MYGITDLKKGTIIELDGQPYKVVDYSQKVMGRGGSIVNVKIKNLVDSKVLDKTFKGSEKVKAAQIDKLDVQYLYKDDSQAHFMDQTNFNQFDVDVEKIDDNLPFMKEGTVVKLEQYNSSIIGVELPVKVPLKVIESPEVVKGDTQSTVMKSAILETGHELQVPMFIKQDDTIIVDTRDGTYVERKK